MCGYQRHFEDTRSIVEPSGALGVAGMKKYIQQTADTIDHKKKTYIPILSGANMNFDRLRFVSERAVLGEGKEVSFVVTIQKDLVICQASKDYSSSCNYGILLQIHRTINRLIFMSVSMFKTRTRRWGPLLAKMSNEDHKYEVVDISDNELAKTYGRYLVGGKTERSSKTDNEVVPVRIP